MKMPLTTYYCISKDCGWQVTDHKLRDGQRCLKCGLPTNSYLVKDKKSR